MEAAYSDKYLLNKTLELSKKFNIETFFETGTNEGKFTKIICKYFKKVVTVENSDKYYISAKENLKDLPNCHLHLGESPSVLRRELENENSSVFIFLDAHWWSYFPLLDELSAIKEKNIKPVIAIYDFFVPDDNDKTKSKFPHMTYGGTADFNYIKNHIEDIYGIDGFCIEYNKESDINSGTIFIYPKL